MHLFHLFIKKEMTFKRNNNNDDDDDDICWSCCTTDDWKKFWFSQRNNFLIEDGPRFVVRDLLHLFRVLSTKSPQKVIDKCAVQKWKLLRGGDQWHKTFSRVVPKATSILANILMQDLDYLMRSKFKPLRLRIMHTQQAYNMLFCHNLLRHWSWSKKVLLYWSQVLCLNEFLRLLNDQLNGLNGAASNFDLEFGSVFQKASVHFFN